MMDSRFQIHKLSETETVKYFDCGDDDLNDFILNEASLYRKAKLAVTYVVIDVSKNEVVAYFSLANDKVSVAEFTNRTEFNRFRKKRFVNEKRIKGYPAVKLCRLAVAKSAYRYPLQLCSDTRPVREILSRYSNHSDVSVLM